MPSNNSFDVVTALPYHPHQTVNTGRLADRGGLWPSVHHTSLVACLSTNTYFVVPPLFFPIGRWNVSVYFHLESEKADKSEIQAFSYGNRFVSNENWCYNDNTEGIIYLYLVLLIYRIQLLHASDRS